MVGNLEREQGNEKQVIGASEVREREGEAFENILVGGADLATLSLFSKIWRDGAHVRKKSQVLDFLFNFSPAKDQIRHQD